MQLALILTCISMHQVLANSSWKTINLEIVNVTSERDEASGGLDRLKALETDMDFASAGVSPVLQNDWYLFSSHPIGTNSQLSIRPKTASSGSEHERSLLLPARPFNAYRPIEEVAEDSRAKREIVDLLSTRAVSIDFGRTIAPDDFEKVIRDFKSTKRMTIHHGFMDIGIMQEHFPSSLEHLTLVDFPFTVKLLNAIESIDKLESLTLVNANCFDVVASPLSPEAESSYDWISKFRESLGGRAFHSGIRSIELKSCEELVFLALSRLEMPSLRSMTINLKPSYFGDGMRTQISVCSLIAKPSYARFPNLRSMRIHVDNRDKLILEDILIKSMAANPKIRSFDDLVAQHLLRQGYEKRGGGLIDQSEEVEIIVKNATGIGLAD